MSAGRATVLLGLRIFVAVLVAFVPVRASSAAAPTRTVTVAYPSTGASRATTALLESPNGVTYVLSLIPDSADDGQVSNLSLILNRPHEAATIYDNLLNPAGNWHGYEEYFFAASDFVHGARRSIFGQTRTVKRPRLGMTVTITIVDVQVVAVPKDSVEGASYRFRNLTLRVVAHRL